jgi:hypothetical protein
MGSIIREERSKHVGEILQHQWEQNYLANRKEIQKQESMRPVFMRSTGNPALVVGAGPSLGRNIRDIDPNLYTIIAVDKVVPKLVEWEIYPDYIVALNSVPTDVEKWIAPANGESCLVMPCVIEPEAYAHWDGPTLFINSEVSTKIHYRVEAECGYPPLVIGSNAGTFAYFMAMYLGHNPIAYCGMDFSFLTRKEVMDKYITGYEDFFADTWRGPYPESTIFSHKVGVPDKRPVYGPYSIIEMTDHNGDVRFLDIGWLNMAETFQEVIKAHREMYDIETYACTEGGINYSQYVHDKTLKEFNAICANLMESLTNEG